MSNIKLFADSSGDLTDELYKKYDISIVPFYVTFNKEQYYKERVEISMEEFYRKLHEDAIPSTSQPSISDYEEAFLPHLEKGSDIICLCLTAKFSGSYSSAIAAAASLQTQFPECKIAVINSILATGVQGLTLLEIARMVENGMGFDAIIAKTDQIKVTGRFFFTLDTLKYLQRNGRVGKANALAGELLGIKPVIALDDGELLPVAKIRGRGKAMQKVLDITLEYAGDHMKDYRYCIMNSDCRDDAKALREKLIAAGCPGEIDIYSIGATIGAHTGVSLVGVGLVRRYETM